MRSLRRPLAGVLLPVTVLLLGLAVPGVAQDPIATYTDGSATTLLRGGVPALDAFTLVSGVRDAAAGSLILEYRQVDGKGTLTIRTPAIPGTHVAPPRPPRGAAVTYRDLRGRTGARAQCTISWVDTATDAIGGSFLCPRERRATGARSRYSLAGTFTARAIPEDGITTGGSPMAIYPVGTTVEFDGRSLTVTGVTDITDTCARGRAKGAKPDGCPPKQLPLTADLRAIAVTACVSDSGAALSLRGKTGLSQILLAGTPEELQPVGLPLRANDPAISTKGLPKVVNQGSCVDGYGVTGATGPLVAWIPAGGAEPVGWTLDPAALPPTAEGPGPEASGAPASPGPEPEGSLTYTSGAADIVVDGTISAAALDLALTEGAYVVDAAGNAVLRLAFASGSDTFTIVLPGRQGSFAWDPGAATATEGIGFVVGEATMDAGLSGCEVEATPTETGGVSGSYLCMRPGGGTASGAFVANP